jgi:hypothetical protein
MIGNFVLTKRTKTKRYTLSVCEGICLIAAVYVICYMLRQDDIFPMSINSAWAYFSHWAKHFHVLAVGLLPVYVALMVFGTASVGIYLGSAIQRWVGQLRQYIL